MRGLRRHGLGRAGRSWIAGLLLSAAADVAVAAKDPAEVCLKKKDLTVGKLVSSLLKCEAKASRTGKFGDSACDSNARAKFLKTFEEIRAISGCGITDDGPTLLAGLEHTVSTVLAQVRPAPIQSKCDALTLKAIAAYGNSLLKAGATQRLRFDPPSFAGRYDKALAKFQEKLGTITASDCQAAPDLSMLDPVNELAGLSGPRRGLITIQLSYAVPESARDAVLAAREEIERGGLSISSDGATISEPSAPGVEYLLQFGQSSKARSDANGSFVISPVPGEAIVGDIFHPTDDMTVVAHFSLFDLVRESETPSPIVLTVTHNGPLCGMHGGDPTVPNFCPVDLGELISQLRHPMRAAATADGPPQGTDSHGTTPLSQQGCLDYDGYIPAPEPQDFPVNYVHYPGSTCHQRVQAGCCQNEQADIVNGVLAAIYPKTHSVLSCDENHKGRYCQSVTPADLAIELPSGAVLNGAGPFNIVEVVPGGVTPITIHNNGCYGRTFVSQVKADAHGTLKARGVTLGGISGSLEHYSGTTYDTDVVAQYEAPTDCTGQFVEDEYRFSADGLALGVRFRTSCLAPCDVTGFWTATCPGCNSGHTLNLSASPQMSTPVTGNYYIAGSLSYTANGSWQGNELVIEWTYPGYGVYATTRSTFNAGCTSATGTFIYTGSSNVYSFAISR